MSQLTHYGVKGMKWGVRKDRGSRKAARAESSAAKTQKKALSKQASRDSRALRSPGITKKQRSRKQEAIKRITSSRKYASLVRKKDKKYVAGLVATGAAVWLGSGVVNAASASGVTFSPGAGKNYIKSTDQYKKAARWMTNNPKSILWDGVNIRGESFLTAVDLAKAAR